MKSSDTKYLAQASLALRLVIGWTYFSAFWRRLILENKLIEEQAGYIGEKFNHFLPNALFVKPFIEHLVSNPEQLWWTMVIFTIVEAIVGLLLMLGLLTRWMSIATSLLALGILFSAGWIGTTCLDEWQIGVLGIAGGLTIFYTGGGNYSLDHYLLKGRADIFWQRMLERLSPKIMLCIALFVLGLTLMTNQVFHGGVWGTLHNKSVRPELAISLFTVTDKTVNTEIMRVEGADVYGSFLIGIHLKDKEGNIIYQLQPEDLSRLDQTNISNFYVAKIKPGKYSLEIPLGAKALLHFKIPAEVIASDIQSIHFIDISGKEWKKNI
ncbi:TQO small subunit DoxD [Gynurincola endophyticus]|uniref:TQO small subunit DoxD n=1 Tax=Gynurincola endophyticus TaxID=2479004 RepID=UPI000F8C9DFF|nr:TQO small subunit DoxD [Gynurincola endophyticus]